MGGWMIGYSLPMELETALYYAAPKEQYVVANLQPALLELVQSVQSDWRREWAQVIHEIPRSFAAFNLMGSWAGSLFESDFRDATVPMRELRIGDAIEVRRTQLRVYGENLEPNGTPLAQLQQLEQQMDFLLYEQMGLANPNREMMKRRIATEVERCAAFLRDGALHSSFWLLVDRFYYETYAPWRATRIAEMERQAQRAALVLGGKAVNDNSHDTEATLDALRGNLPFSPVRHALTATGDGASSPFPSGVRYYDITPPALEWLPMQNSLRTSARVTERVEQGKTVVYFWVEPFEMFDAGFVEPGIFAASFAEPGLIYENFRTFVERLGSRAQAFADPTRLLIMRMIRHFSLDNTTMSNYMGVSRPTVSEHARILREAGFIKTYQEGRQARHVVQPEAVAEFLRDLKEYLDLDIEL